MLTEVDRVLVLDRSGGPPSRLAVDGSHSGGRYGETVFAYGLVASDVR